MIVGGIDDCLEEDRRTKYIHYPAAGVPRGTVKVKRCGRSHKKTRDRHVKSM